MSSIELLRRFEIALEQFEKNRRTDASVKAVRRALAEAIVAVCQLQSIDLNNFEHVIDEVVAANKGKRESALLLMRVAGVDDLLPENTPQNGLDRKIVSIVEAGAPDLCKYIKLNEKQQNFEKFGLLVGAHDVLTTPLRVLQNLPDTLEELEKLKGEVGRALRHGQSQAYLQLYDWPTFRGKLEILLDYISEVVTCRDATFKVKFDALNESIADLKSHCGTAYSFLARDYLAPFALGVERAVKGLEKDSAEKFRCVLEPLRRLRQVAEKRYPLHQEGRLITVSIPMVNKGPGVAIATMAEVDVGSSESVVIDQPELHLGDIPPGEFALVFRMLVDRAETKVDFTVQLSWSQLFGQSGSVLFDAELVGQDPNVNWAGLEHLEPYSLEVAEGEMFVGRAAKVQAIANRLTKAQMTSTYITGQKRVGKTSLARAVLRNIEEKKGKYQYHSLYLEYGEYCRADAAATVKVLGEMMHDFLKGFVPRSVQPPLADFTGSLAPLNALARLLESNQPSRRFVVVLDEFDEIHPEMYRFGPLAETFFANLRTLSTRRNLAFLLVGGERMPFIIGAQGDQLNKFAREPLDYFSRSSEWADYVELVTKPVKGALNWDEPAINALYNLTNGHPYYTNLLCGRVFSRAVRERDTEVIPSNVEEAANALIPELDTNAFAHLWKDGIDAAREQAEVSELRRLRVLVGLGRALRVKEGRVSSIIRHVGSLRLQEHEVRPVIEDFHRRDIVAEHFEIVTFTLPLFQRWLQEVGVKKLIASTFADELETEIRRVEDEAFVNASEIQAVVSKWEPYKGRAVGAEALRAWLGQVPTFQDQRLLFKIAQHVRFVSIVEIERMLTHAHEKVVRLRIGTETIGRKARNEKRRDIWVTYVGGPGKSSAFFARRYAKDNDILMECVMDSGKVGARLSAPQVNPDDIPRVVVIVDDLLGTGETLGDALNVFLTEFGSAFSKKAIPIMVIGLIATQEGEITLRRKLPRIDGLAIFIHICEYLDENAYAFPTDSFGFWKDGQEKDRAKSLCVRLGTGLYKEPLGYAGQGLLLTFPDTCPNNSLPILFATRTGTNPWTPLFSRT
jgi:hypothetical protein